MSKEVSQIVKENLIKIREELARFEKRLKDFEESFKNNPDSVSSSYSKKHASLVRASHDLKNVLTGVNKGALKIWNHFKIN